ncbi:uncharacterized protein [Palaemon carinicauda]|uniref:uncharacterized protein n=1 Tax=Palaemon carinicauda TaxID=392227 RepID=UPI0035B5DE4C
MTICYKNYTENTLKGTRTSCGLNKDCLQRWFNRIFPMFIKIQTTMRDPLTVVLKLAVTLHFMTSRDSYKSLQYSFRGYKTVICRFVPKVCEVIIDTNKHAVLKCPKTPKDWKTVSEVLVKKWNYHIWGGALDGKHVPIKKPRKDRITLP